MKKTLRNLLGVALALVMCLTMAPATTAKADEAVALSEYTENQLVAAFMGEWEGANRGVYAILSRNHIKMWNDEKDETVIDTDWTYEGLVEVEVDRLTYEDWEAWLNGETTNARKTKAVEFTGGGYVVYLYVVYDAGHDTKVLTVAYTNETTDHDGKVRLLSKTTEDGGRYVSELLEASLTATETPVEEPKTEEPVEETETKEAPSTAYIKGEDDEALTTLTLEVGELHDLNFDGIDDFNLENYSYTWISNAPEVAKVDQKGNVTAVAAGSATVTVSIVDNRDGNVVEVTPVVITVPTVIVEEEPTTETPIEEPKTEESTGAPTEEPKTEEPTETPTVETEDKEIVEKTKDGRFVYTGEAVYIVKKGDCLWSIAKQLLGNGARYKELFTRNNGIIEKAKLIFPGQEVIVPAK